MAPSALLVLLEVGVAWEIFSIADRAWAVGLLVAFGTNVPLVAAAEALHSSWARRLGLLFLGGTYVVAHAFVLGIQLLPALAVVTLMIAYVQVRILAERFAPLFLSSITSVQRQQFGRALRKALTRLAAALVVAVVVPLFAADLAVAGVVPLTTIPSALLLSVGLVAVVVLIALLPTLDAKASEGRGRFPTARNSPKPPP
jgi:hypothetical protein